MSYSENRDILLQLARDSIQNGLDYASALKVDKQNFPEVLHQQRATFVTLEIDGELRGCIGSLNAYQSLIEDIAHNAFAAAFRDPRFPPLREDEFNKIEIHISILSPPEPMSFKSQQDLLEQIRPNIDGLILEAEGRRGTFLPTVWESLPTAEQFLTHLKNKAGLPMDYWSDQVKMWRYTTELIC